MNDIKIVFHVDWADRWQATIGNLRNLTRDYPSAKARVVANGFGVLVFQGDNEQSRALAELAEKGVEFEVCRNALRERGMDVSTLPDYAKVVPAGIVALAEAQREGYAYVKP